MVILTANNLTRQFDVEPVFSNVSFDVRAGEKVGIVGPNGAGKTTLLRVLTRKDEPDTGTVEIPSSVRIGILEQHKTFGPDETLIDVARSGLGHLYALQEEATEIAVQMGEVSDPDELEKLTNRYDVLHHELERLDAYQIDHHVDEVLHGLGFAKDDYDRPMKTFSGGQQNRVTLAKMLLEAPDLILLDEPTNHLDIETTEWLEDYLSRCAQAIIVVSHDRYFLDKVTTRTLEVFRGGIDDYPGNFSKYWSMREERHDLIRRTRQKQEDYLAKQEQFIRKNQVGTKATQAKDRAKKMERVELVELPPDFTELRMGFSEPVRTGDWVLRSEDVSKGFPSPETGEVVPLFKDVTLQVDRGDRIGILGPNGAGKTTLLRTLIGELEADSGTLKYGTNVDIAYFDQQLKSVDHSLDAVEAVRPEKFPDMTPGKIRSLLAKFGISGELGLQRLSLMSGGEKTKVALAKLAALQPNVMVLDEPTNHLDFWACSALERSLRQFNGTILFVSHDRYFLDQVATRVISLEPERYWDFEGNYSAFQESQQRRKNPVVKLEVKPIAAPKETAKEAFPKTTHEKARRKRQFPFRQVSDLEADIAAQEAVILDLEIEMADPDIHRDPKRMKTIQKDYDAANAELERLLSHWEEAVELN